MPVSTHRPYFAKLALGSFSVFKWQPCASRPAVRHRSPAARLKCRRPTQPLRGRHGIPGAGRHGTWRRPTRHLAPADTALGAGRLAQPAAADTPTPPADSPRPTQTLSIFAAIPESQYSGHVDGTAVRLIESRLQP